MKFTHLILVGLFSFATSVALSWDGIATGKIVKMEITDSENFGVRVVLDKSICGSENLYWAYLNGSDSNYKTYVAALLMARALNQQITVYANKVWNGQFCHIGHLATY